MTTKNEHPVVIERARFSAVQQAKELQHYGTVARVPIALDAAVCAAGVENLNQLLADTMTVRDLYKKHHWQVSGQHFADDAAYVNFRVYKTHDIHHILTGFSLDDLGEIGVISVSSAQFGFPAFVFLGLLGMLLRFFSSEQLYREDLPATEIGQTLGYTYRVLSIGVEIGQAAKPLFPVKWEEGLERPLAEWREELNIHPVTDGIFSWYTRPQLAAAVA